MKNVLIILVGVIVLATASHTPGFAQEGKPPHVPPIPTPQGRGREVHPPRRGADLIAAAQTQGPMKVIVELNVPFIPEGRLINPGVETVATSGAVRAQRAAIADTKRALISQMVGHNVTVTATWEGLPGIAVTANAAALQALQNSPLVRSIYEDVPEPPVMGYNLPYLSVSSAGGAWDQGVDGSGQTVAVLDVGTFASHEFLSGKVVAEACFSTNSPSANPLYDAHSLCPGAATSYTGSGAADPYARCVGLAGSFNCGHGTHVAGIIAGNWGSYSASSLVQPINMGGVARGANLIPIQVFTYFSDCDGTTGGNQPCLLTYSSDQISAINYVYNTLSSVGPGAGPYDIASINLSLGAGRYTTPNCDSADPNREAALAQLRGVGIAPVIAAGNSGYTDAIAIPGCLSAAVAVGATETNFLSGPVSTYISPTWPTNAWCMAHLGITCYGSGTEKLAYFSNASPAMELLAPGYYIESSVLGADSSVTNSYVMMAGTSMASPVVAGAWAVLKQQSPVATVDRILGTLQSTGVGIADSPYVGNYMVSYSPLVIESQTFRSAAPGTVYKRIDVGAAVLALGRDFGDAPASYDTLNADNGARHIRVPEYYLGASADSEADGTPGVDDGEDNGITFPTMNIGTTVNVDVIASVAQVIGFAPDDGYLGRLYGWIDFNQDGDFADAGEQVVNGLVMTGPYPQAVPIMIPEGAMPGSTWARFRYSTETGLSYDGQAYNGEVEDYPITLISDPEIEVAGPGPVAISDGGSYDLGATVVGTPVTHTITVSNVGGTALNLLTDPPAVTGDFSATYFGTTTVAAGGSTTFDLTCDATSAGSPVSGTVSFDNNDSNENPFDFTVTCTVLAPPAAPSNLMATGVSGVEIDLSWTDNSSDEMNFHIERSPSGLDDWREIATVPANVTTYSDSGLTCNTAYDYQVRAYRSGVINLFSDYSNVATGTTTNQCPPTLVSPPDGTLTYFNTPTFEWEPLGWAVMYRIQVDLDPAFGSPAVDAVVNDTTYTPLAQLADGTYHWHVQGLDAGSHPGEWSDAWTVAIDPARLAAPGLVRPRDHTHTRDTTPTFLWTNVRGAVLYEIQVSDDYDFATTLVDAQPTSRKYILPAAEALDYGVYYWRVRVQGTNGNWSDWSYTNTLTITILASPKNAQHLTDTTPRIRWQSAARGALYEVEVDEVAASDGDFATPVFTYSGTGHYISVTPELPAGDYQWRARADTGTGWSVWTPVWTFTITPPTTTRPALISPANRARLDTTTPNFSWNAVPNGVIYQIQISASSNFRTPVQDVKLDPGVLTYTADPLADGGRYFWRVRAINAQGVAGAWSARWYFTLNQLTRPVLLSPATRTQTTDTTPDLSWYPVTDAVSYEIQLDMDRRFGTPDRTLTTAGTTVTPAALPDGRYYWRVRAVNASGVTGLWSAKWHVTVDTTGPDQPVLRSPKDLAGTRDTTPRLIWKNTRTAKQYWLQVAEDAAFSQIKIDVMVSGRYYTIPAADALDYGVHYWRVKAFDALGNEGEWSTPFQFALTTMISPRDGTTTTSLRPTFRWAAVSGASAYYFELDDNEDFSSPVETYTGLNRAYRPATPLAAGMYYWHVNVDGGDWMPTWTLVITPARPGRPGLSSPSNRAILGDNTPTFDWRAATNGSTYQIQIDDNGDFSSPAQDVTVGAGLLSYVADELPDARYFWHVRAFNIDGAPGPWSARWYFTLDTVAPPVPELLAPIDQAASTNRMLRLSWTKVEGASAYELRLDQDDTFPLPVISTGNRTTYTPPTPLSRSIYWWQVRALDKAGNASEWSDPRRFEIVAGVTAPGVEPPTPLPTEAPAPTAEPSTEPTVEPTTEPTDEPTQPPEPTVEPTQPPEPTIEPTPEPTVEPTVEPPAPPPDNGLPTLSPPVSEPFDSKGGWQAKGFWKFSRKVGVEGGGWFADSSRRGATSVLIAPALIDLTGAQAPSLHFWQRVGLSSGDLVAVDVSTDGGQTWQPLDQQRGHLAEWSERTVDLSAYRGQVIRLRFRLDTRGRVPQGEKSVGWWIDNLGVIDAP